MQNLNFFKTLLALILSTSLLSAQDFHSTLNKQINDGSFSPLSFSFSDMQVLPSWIPDTIDSNEMSFTSDNKIITISFSPFNIIYWIDGVEYTAGYNFNVDKKIVKSLNSPQKKQNTYVFDTNVKGVKLRLTPTTTNLMWEIEGDVDELLIEVTAQGPFFGGGERFVTTNLTNNTVVSRPHDRLGIYSETRYTEEHYKKYDPSYFQIPYLLNSKGQGWYVDNASTVSMACDSAGKSFIISSDSKLKLFVMCEESPKKLLSTYTQLMGRQPMPPEWGMGVWINLLEGRDSVLSKAYRLKEWEIPSSAVWLFDYMDPTTSTGWDAWSRGYYGDIAQLVDQLHKMDLKVLTYLTPFNKRDLTYYRFDNPVHSYLDSLGVLLKTGSDFDPQKHSLFMHDCQYDFFDKKILEPWQGFVQKLLIEDKFDGWMQDFGDTRYAFDRDNLKWFAVKHNKSYPLSAEEYANTYPLVYHKLTYEIADGINPDFMHFCRSSSAGSAPYQKLLWGGDQSATWNKIHGYPSLVTAGISAGLSGYGYWAPDVLCNSPSRELWMRWVQFATFTTVLRDHLWENKKSSIDLWTDMETRVYFKKYAKIHMQLVPYLRKMAEQYKAHGTPIIRHMMLEFPDDRNTLECEYQYMFGDSYLVAPVVEEGATTINIYFPKGEWKSFWSNDTITSYGEWINVVAPIDQIPVFEMLR